MKIYFPKNFYYKEYEHLYPATKGLVWISHDSPDFILKNGELDGANIVRVYEVVSHTTKSRYQRIEYQKQEELFFFECDDILEFFEKYPENAVELIDGNLFVHECNC